MNHSSRLKTVLVLAILTLLLVPSAGCGLFSGDKEERREVVPPLPPPPPPTPTPAASPPPPLRASGAQIADEESLRALVQGKTTKDEVRERFGIPQEVLLVPGSETFVYFRDRTSGWISPTTERIEMLTIRFDAKGVLKDFEYRYSGK